MLGGYVRADGSDIGLDGKGVGVVAEEKRQGELDRTWRNGLIVGFLLGMLVNVWVWWAFLPVSR